MSGGISFKTFINTYNFRLPIDCDTFDTKIIRIYFGETSDNWFEFGVYDFDSNKWDRCSDILSNKILKSNVIEFCYKDSIGAFCVWLDV